jgi:hypothetical protein
MLRWRVEGGVNGALEPLPSFGLGLGLGLGG